MWVVLFSNVFCYTDLIKFQMFWVQVIFLYLLYVCSGSFISIKVFSCGETFKFWKLQYVFIVQWTLLSQTIKDDLIPRDVSQFEYGILFYFWVKNRHKSRGHIWTTLYVSWACALRFVFLSCFMWCWCCSDFYFETFEFVNSFISPADDYWPNLYLSFIWWKYTLKKAVKPKQFTDKNF